MPRVVILTPALDHDDHPLLWRRVLGRLQTALANVDIDVVTAPWTGDGGGSADLREADCVLPLLAWGYHRDHARWLEACARWQQSGVAMANPSAVLAWNSDKAYLAELQARGIAIPATVFTDTVSQDDVDRMFDETGADALIIKPAVSGGAWKTQRLQRGDQFEPVAGVSMLLQPYLPTIETLGETSLLYFGGRFSHAVNKRPISGDFRIQEEFGGMYAQVTPGSGAFALAEQVLAGVGEPLLYARIDMVPDAEGRWLLMEAELIEPDFYLGVDPAGGDRFASALNDWIRKRATA